MTRIPFHPLLFAMLPVLSMFAANPGQRHDHELTDALRIVVGGAGVLLLLAAVIYRDVRKAALAASALLLALCVQIDDGSIGGVGNKRFVMPLMYLGIIACWVWLYRRRTPLEGLTGLANMVALGAVLPPAVILGSYSSSALEASATRPNPIVAGTVKAKPDIYYVIFDRYGDEQTARTYGLENDIGDT